MPVLNFKARFAADVESGLKRQTMRLRGKLEYRPDSELYLYTEQRTKNCRNLGESICTEVVPIDIMFMKTSFLILSCGDYSLDPYDNNYKSNCPIDNDELAIADGFEDEESFTGFFVETYKLGWADVLALQIIKWGKLL